MKRNGLLATVLGVSAALAAPAWGAGPTDTSAPGQDGPPTGCGPAPAAGRPAGAVGQPLELVGSTRPQACAAVSGCPHGTRPRPGGVPVVEDLVAILNETKSRDTFVVTVMVLKKMGAEARPALPAVVRNAERLGLFKGLCLSDDSSKRRAVAREVVEALEHIAQEAGEGSAKTAPTPVYPGFAPPTVYRGVAPLHEAPVPVAPPPPPLPAPR